MREGGQEESKRERRRGREGGERAGEVKRAESKGKGGCGRVTV